MKIPVTGINHVAIAPSDPAKAQWFFGEVLGLEDDGQELVQEQATVTHFFEIRQKSNPRIEIVTQDPAQASGPIKNYLEKRGSGIHHIAFTVTSIEDTIRILKDKGVQLVTEQPQCGAHQTRIVFVHPKSTGGILVEFSEPRSHS